jgi:GNAT superfamily N-acetyltransferase
MTKPEFTIAKVAFHRSELIQLNIEYVSWVMSEFKREFGVSAEDVVGMSASEYVHSVIEKVCGDPPPKGVFYLVRVDSQLAGMGGLRCVCTGISEIKRIYIRPEFRGMKLGEHIMDRLLEDAKSFGYQVVCLESGPFMKSAHRLYERNGFRDCPVYEGVEVPEMFHDRWRFMERTL